MSNINKWGIPVLSGKAIRQGFVDYFVRHDHQNIKSSPVVPHDDPTLLFVNSGMNQFKAVFLGDNRQGLKRVVNSQKCLRVSGKHNDLDEVGRDTYHQTFFEMLGNWSFGDYYKKEAIGWAWDLLTNVWKLPKDRLFVTVYKDDDEAEEIWKSVTDIDHWRILRFGEKENFWEMGDVGPCGPCTEIHFDMGDAATQQATYKDKIHGVNGTNARYIEIWNNVFMQFERMQDSSLKPLKHKHVDTGMGFERICSIIQGSGSNYETDVFRPLLDKISALSGVSYDPGEKGTPHRVIADHVRALAFAIADGATPGNEGRGYVLRRILRRASRFSQELNQKEPFIYKLIPTLVQTMGDVYPEIAQRQDYISQVILAEEERFVKTLKDGLTRFAKIAQETKNKGAKVINGVEVFTLYDTYGFPSDLTSMLAEEQGLSIDHEGFAAAMEEQRERARSSAKFDASIASDEGWTILLPGVETKFLGYETLSADAKVLRYREVGDDLLVVLDRTPFYAEGGGQVGDIGILKNDHVTLKVTDTYKVLDIHVHKCSLLHGLLKKEHMQALQATVDKEAREATVRNHSATHLLQAALIKVLGSHVQQQGSRVGPDGLRFDFTHPRSLTAEESQRIEQLVNEEILKNSRVAAEVKPLEQAKKEGATALFGEKYADSVRTIKMGSFSYELCGGTHANATGDIGLLKVISESSIAAGIRRIEAVTGLGALSYLSKQANIVGNLARTLKVKPDGIEHKVDELAKKVSELDKEIKSLKTEQINTLVGEMIARSSTQIGGVSCIVKKLDTHQVPKALHQVLLDSFAAKLNNGVAVMTHVEDGTLSLLAAVGDQARAKVKAGDLIKELSKVADGRGGGRPDKAQAGSKFPEKESAVIEAATKLLQQSLA